MTNFAKLLKESMRSKNITQQKLASEIGVSRQAVSGYLRGKSSPNAVILARICKALNVSAEYLLGFRTCDKTAGEIESEISDIIKSLTHDLLDIMMALDPKGAMSNDEQGTDHQRAGTAKR